MNMKLGPNKVEHYYQPAPYHSYKAKIRKDKTRWIANANFEYEIFNLADEHDGRVLSEEPLIRDVRWCLIREKVVTFRMVKLNLLLSIFLITK